MNTAYGFSIIAAAVLSTGLWVVTAWLIHPLVGDTMHRIHVYLSVVAFILTNMTVLVATADGPVMAVFGLAMGVQLVAASAGLLFARRHRGPG